MSEHLQHCGVYGAEQSTVDSLPRDPAVYAFYDIFRFGRPKLVDQIDAFKTHHGRRISVSEEDMPDRLLLRLRGNPDRFKGDGLKLCKALRGDHVETVTSALAFLSLLNDPLYIGKTSNMRDRFRAHHDKDFLYSMKDRYRRSADEFLLFAYFCDERHARVLESILIQLINPPFCDQKS